MHHSGRILYGTNIGVDSKEIVTGHTVILDEALCFIAVDPATGCILDEFHPQNGMTIKEKILVLPGSRGGGGTPGQLCEAIRVGAGPIAIVLPEPDPPILAACLVAKDLYDLTVPVIVADRDTYASITEGELISLTSSAH